MFLGFLFLLDLFYFIFIVVCGDFLSGSMSLSSWSAMKCVVLMTLVLAINGMKSVWGSWIVLVGGLSLVFIVLNWESGYYFLLNEWFAIDGMSILMQVMCVVVFMGSIVASGKEVIFSKNSLERCSDEAVRLIVFICLVSMIFFVSGSWMEFYFFFELSLFPTLWLILSYGGQPERFQAALALLLYTAGASMPLLFGLVVLWDVGGSDHILLMKYLWVFCTDNSFPMWGLMFLCFLVKLPVYFFHSWLPMAHVEAPLSGSMILAGLLLKYGGYGMIRLIWMINLSLVSWVIIVLVAGLWGGVISSCVCFSHSDLKATVAYSSIGHMSLCLGGILSLYPLGKLSSVCLMFAHGVCSPALFVLAASLVDINGSRNIMLARGIMRIFPAYSFFWCVYCIINMGFPPFLNFFGEVFCISSCIWLSSFAVLSTGSMVFLAGCYSLLLYAKVNHGGVSLMDSPCSGISDRYLYVLAFFGFWLFMGFFMLDYFFV